MKKRTPILTLSILAVFLLTVTLASAGATCLTVNSKNTQSYLNELPSLNTQLTNCKIVIPSTANFIVKDGNILVAINMNDGSTENFYITIKNNELSSFTYGTTQTFTHTVTLSEDTMDKILNSNDAASEITKGIKNGDIKVTPKSIFGKIKWFFAKFFIPTPAPAPAANNQNANVPAGPTGKPDYCDDTYLPGHREYANNKALWDSYSANTDKVCQSQYGKGIPSPCIYKIQLSISGNPYYLCWYNE